MIEGCIGNCLLCGKCKGFAILDSFCAAREIEPREGTGIAIDVGTTTVVLALLDLSAGEVLARHSFMNPQRAYGPDVISRIDAANNGALDDLRRMIAESIAAGIDALLASCGLTHAGEIVLAGNTVMTHLLLGLPCQSLGVVPFKPVCRLEERYNLFGSSVTLLPWLAGFVGGDILAGLLYVPRKSRFLLIDLGTNGEMALYDNGKLTVTATAAGPAFEGGSQLGGASGVISALARLVRTGAIDETGLLEGESVFTQKEIRSLQLAKSAVRSGLEILLDSAGLETASLDAVYLAGGIGQALNAEDAADIGLLPPKLTGRVSAVGNASLGGAARLLLSPARARQDMDALLSAVTEINLAEHPRFNDLFMESMMFEG
ncbi:MAG: ASKHA domain-containing protein [Oscillospiraceae bacterium]|nr:ASKHA domain-containing protein [Oscillospiraceae bacterium]